MFKVLVLLMFSASAFAQPEHKMCDWPQSDLRIDVAAGTGISKAEFDSALNVVQNVYAPIFQKWGCPLKIKRSWADNTPNAQAWRSWSGTCYIEMFGGLARHPKMTYGGFIQVALHEIGHHIGGSPYYSGESMSVEGQADYYSTRWGMPALGYSSIASSRALSDTLASLSGEPMTSLPGPWLPNVTVTMEGHPPAQCRRVTYDAGRRKAGRPGCWFKL